MVVRAERVAEADPARTPATLTVVEVDESLPASTEVADAVQTAAGVTVNRLGGLGDWASVSIRGASARQVVVALDGVPLNPDGSAAVNLSELPLRSFQRVEVYRGAAPPELATAAMGGVVNLVSREGGAPPSVALGLGSMRTGRLHADGGVRHGPSSGFLAVDGFTTSGAFRYFDDQRTPYNLHDDRLRVRANNDAHQVNALGRVRTGGEGWRVTVLDAFLWRDEGVPGPISVPTTTVRYGVTRNLAVAQVDGGVGATRLQGRVWGQWRQERFDDREAEIGLGTQWTRDTTTTVGALADVRHAAADAVVLDLVGDLHLDRYASLDRLSGDATPARMRWSGSLAASASIRDHGDRLLLVPVVQGQWLRSVDGTPGSAGSHVTTTALVPRLGVLVRPVEGVALKANVGRYLRPPDFLELFGDRGAFVGQPDLRPEKGWQADLGARVSLPEQPVARGTVEVTGFATASEDLIAYVQNGQRVVIPVNIGRSRVVGLEAAASLRWGGWVETQTNLTASVSTNLSQDPAYAGNQLPRVPAWEVYQRTAVAPGDRWRIGHTVSFTAGEYWDATNWHRATPRTLHGVFVRVLPHPAWALEGEILNLGDQVAEVVPRNPLDPADPARIVQPVTDFAGYPLPGRTFLATVRWQPRRPE